MVLVLTCIFSLLLEAINISSEKLVIRKIHLLNVCMKEVHEKLPYYKVIQGMLQMLEKVCKMFKED